MTTAAQPDFVYMFDDGGSPQSAYIYDFNYNDRQYTLIFSVCMNLYDMCVGVYSLTGQSGVFSFVNQHYVDDIEWGVCIPCDCESPFETVYPEYCLVCGSNERDDDFEFTGRDDHNTGVTA